MKDRMQTEIQKLERLKAQHLSAAQACQGAIETLQRLLAEDEADKTADKPEDTDG